MLGQSKNRHLMDILFLLILLGVFVISAILLILLGSRVYQNTISNMSANYDTRTAFAYLTEKFHQQDTADAVSVEPFGESQAVVLTQKIQGKPYATYLYLYQGSIRELFAASGSKLSPQAGQEILPCQHFSVDQVGPELYHISLTDPEQESLSLYISTRSGGSHS